MLFSMKIIDLYKETVIAVCKETGICESDLIHSNSEEIEVMLVATSVGLGW